MTTNGVTYQGQHARLAPGLVPSCQSLKVHPALILDKRGLHIEGLEALAHSDNVRQKLDELWLRLPLVLSERHQEALLDLNLSQLTAQFRERSLQTVGPGAWKESNMPWDGVLRVRFP